MPPCRYEPILWPALRVANPAVRAMVRAHAATLLVDTFTLQDPDETHAEIDALLQQASLMSWESY